MDNLFKRFWNFANCPIELPSKNQRKIEKKEKPVYHGVIFTCRNKFLREDDPNFELINNCLGSLEDFGLQNIVFNSDFSKFKIYVLRDRRKKFADFMDTKIHFDLGMIIKAQNFGILPSQVNDFEKLKSELEKLKDQQLLLGSLLKYKKEQEFEKRLEVIKNNSNYEMLTKLKNDADQALAPIIEGISAEQLKIQTQIEDIESKIKLFYKEMK